MERLRRMRTEKGLSQARLAARAGVDPSTVNQIERGAREASPTTLRKLADALDVGIADLLEEASPKGSGRSSLEPNLFNGLESEWPDIYTPWLRFIVPYADRWEAKIAAGALNQAEVVEFVRTIEDLSPALAELGTKEKGEQPDQFYFKVDPIIGEAISRLMRLLGPVLKASAKQFEESELAQLRRKREEIESLTAQPEKAADG